MAAMRTIVLVFVLLLTVAPAAAKPARIVSLFLCTDDLVLRLAERENVASVSYWAANPATSNVAGKVGDLHQNHGLAEEVLPLEPDLVLSGQFTARGTTALLRRLGYRVEVIPIANDLDDVRANIRRVAALLGEEARGRAVIAAFDRRIAQATQGLPGGPLPVAAYYWTGGFSAGSGSLADAVMAKAGFRNYAPMARLGPAGRFPLELVATAPIDALILSDFRDGTVSMSRDLLRHPALMSVTERVPTETLPRRLLACGTPAVAEAVARLAALRRRVADR